MLSALQSMFEAARYYIIHNALKHNWKYLPLSKLMQKPFAETKYNSLVVLDTIKYDRLSALQFLAEKYELENVDTLIVTAVYYKRQEIIAWFMDKFTSEILTISVLLVVIEECDEKDALRLCGWFVESNPDFLSYGILYDTAAKFGHLNLLKYLRNKNNDNFLWMYVSSHAAAANLDIDKSAEMLTWCREQRLPLCWCEYVSLAAAKNKNINLLFWLRKQDPPCPWEELSCLEALADNSKAATHRVSVLCTERGYTFHEACL